MAKAVYECERCGRQYETHHEAMHCESVDTIMNTTGRDMARHCRYEDVRQLVHDFIVMLGNAGFVNQMVDPAPYKAPPKAPAHGHPEPGT